jgi:GntR family transcriptional regulator/MocR family aminotransferase
VGQIERARFMRESLFHLRQRPGVSIQASIREMLVSVILNEQLPADRPLPSCRELARRLGVSRNTVVLAYQGLVDDGFIIARLRSGYYVNPDILENPPRERVEAAGPPVGEPDWEAMFRVRPGAQPNIEKPANWQSYPYPFVYGQIDPGLFPIAAWRECTRQALGLKGIGQWTADSLQMDDPDLVEQIRTRVLPRRGIWVSPEEILVTLGAQNALYLLASLFVTPQTTVAMEDPGYPDVRNIFALKTDKILPITVDDGGLPVDKRLDACDMVFVTPSHQFPTTVTMPAARRAALLQRAADSNFLVVEDDYEFETDALVRRLHRVYRTRWQAMDDALSRHLPESARAPNFGGTSVWVRGPDGLDSKLLADRALGEGIVIEPGHVHFMAAPRPRNFFRLGFSAIPEERIEPGIRLLADLVRGQKTNRG